jgi:hypothetical protein
MPHDTLAIVGQYEGGCITALASGDTITLTPDTLKYDIQEGEDLIRCFKVSGSNTGDVTNVQNLQVTVTVNEDNAISVSSVPLGAGTATSTSALTIDHSVGAAQCTGNSPAIGGEVCLELTTEGTAVVNTVSAWTFSHGATTFTALGKSYTDVSGCDGTSASCQIKTYLPESFYNGGEAVSSAGTADLLIAARRLRSLSEDDTVLVLEIAAFDTPIAVQQTEGFSGMKQGSVAALTIVGLSSVVALII